MSTDKNIETITVPACYRPLLSLFETTEACIYMIEHLNRAQSIALNTKAEFLELDDEDREALSMLILLQDYSLDVVKGLSRA